MTPARSGLLAIVAANVIWGLSPIYYKALAHVPALEVLAHRTLWSLITFAALLALQGRLGALRSAFASGGVAVRVALAACLITVNWFGFIWAVQVGLVRETSLGYYIYPLIAVLFGVVLFGERLATLQKAAVALAALAVVVLIVWLGAPPWLSLLLATTFALYGLIKRGLGIGPVVSVTAEVVLLAPIAIWWLWRLHAGGGGAFGQDVWTSVLLALSGVMTALPLIFFSRASQVVAMSTVGLVQYLNPTLQFLCATLLFVEPFGAAQLVAFGLIWLGLALFSLSALRQERAARRAATAPST